MDTNQNNIATANQAATEYVNKTYSIVCSIRRSPFLERGLPGESPLARSYKLSASLAKNGHGPLKGVDGILEKKLMPLVVSTAPNEPEFYKRVNDYWNDIGVEIPADEASFEKIKGKVIDIKFLVTNSVKNQLQKAKSIEEQVNIIKVAIERDNCTIDTTYVPNFLLLCYALVRSSVANVYEDIHKSAKIKFYIYDETVYVASKMDYIKKVSEANKLFNTVITSDINVKALLTLFKVDISQFNKKEEYIIALHNIYTKEENIEKFLAYVADSTLPYKYLIQTAINDNKLSQQPNTGYIYYLDTLIGKSIEDAVMFLKSDVKDAKDILTTLEGETGITVSVSKAEA